MTVAIGDKVSVVHVHYDVINGPWPLPDVHIDHAVISGAPSGAAAWMCPAFLTPIFYACPDHEENICWIHGHVAADSPEALALLAANALYEGKHVT